MPEIRILWPPDFDDYAWEVESKGWLGGLEIEVAGRTVCLAIYEPERLAQEVADEVARRGCFFSTMVIVVERVTRDCIEGAISDLVRSGELDALI